MHSIDTNNKKQSSKTKKKLTKHKSAANLTSSLTHGDVGSRCPVNVYKSSSLPYLRFGVSIQWSFEKQNTLCLCGNQWIWNLKRTKNEMKSSIRVKRVADSYEACDLPVFRTLCSFLVEPLFSILMNSIHFLYTILYVYYYDIFVSFYYDFNSRSSFWNVTISKGVLNWLSVTATLQFIVCHRNNIKVQCCKHTCTRTSKQTNLYHNGSKTAITNRRIEPFFSTFRFKFCLIGLTPVKYYNINYLQGYLQWS